MKQIYTSLFLTFFVSSFALAQTDVTLNILHKLGDQSFEFFQTAENSLDHQFQLDRLEYYLSQISILHDGGIETEIDDLYILVDASEATSIDLGNYAISEIEAIRFSVGVDTTVNHGDPAAFPSTHPLAPQSPSMHWGWASGYRFVALEGFSGEQIDQDLEIHALGDQNYFQTEIAVSATATGGAVSIDLNADYSKALKSINLNSGVFNHGFDEEAFRLLLNFQTSVFSDANMVTSNDDLTNINTFEVYPNPSQGISTLKLSLESDDHYEVNIQTILGTTIQSFNIQNRESLIDFNFKNHGIYFISLARNGKTVLTEKLIVVK